MAGADDNYIELLGELHAFLGTPVSVGSSTKRLP